jgi:hypothetical protein
MHTSEENGKTLLGLCIFTTVSIGAVMGRYWLRFREKTSGTDDRLAVFSIVSISFWLTRVYERYY